MTARQWVVDSIVAVVCWAAVMVQVVNGSPDPEQAFEQPVTTALLLTLAVGPLAVRRTRTLLAAGCFAAGVAAQALVTMDFAASPGLFLSALVLLYTVGAHLERRRALVAVGAVMTVLVGRDVLLASMNELDWWNALFFHVVLLLGAAVGAWARSRAETGRLAAAVVDRAEAVSEERARIARELHDIVAHNMSAAVVQAEAAEEVLASRPDQAAEALHHIQDISREALGEVRRLVGAMRAEQVAPRGVGDLKRLLAEMDEPGLRVALVEEGVPRPLPPGVDLSAYRIVQEALTNVRRHAGRPARATVTLTSSPTAYSVTVVDDGAGGSAGEPGHGLLGMRERALFFGGTFEAGPLAEGGFRVAATFPLPESS